MTKKKATKLFAKPRRVFTPEEDEVVLNYIAKHPQNISQACEFAAAELKRTPASVTSRYYGTLMHDKNRTAVIALGTRSGTRVVDRKVLAMPRKANTPELRLRTLRKCIDKLNPTERESVVDYILGI